MPLYQCQRCGCEFTANATDGITINDDWSINVKNPRCQDCGAASNYIGEPATLADMDPIGCCLRSPFD